MSILSQESVKFLFEAMRESPQNNSCNYMVNGVLLRLFLRLRNVENDIINNKKQYLKENCSKFGIFIPQILVYFFSVQVH